MNAMNAVSAANAMNAGCAAAQRATEDGVMDAAPPSPQPTDASSSATPPERSPFEGQVCERCEHAGRVNGVNTLGVNGV